jgi:hypothetical protein
MFEEWARLGESPGGDEAQLAFAAQLGHAGLLKGDETTERLLRILVELAVAHCLSSEPPQRGPEAATPPLNFAAVDACARLVLLLVRFLRSAEAAEAEAAAAGNKAPEDKKLLRGAAPHVALFKVPRAPSLPHTLPLPLSLSLTHTHSLSLTPPPRGKPA